VLMMLDEGCVLVRMRLRSVGVRGCEAGKEKEVLELSMARAPRAK
jgi:hypothetical protein